MRVFLLSILMLATALSGCFGDDETITIAFVHKDSATAPTEDLDRLAAFIEEQTGHPTEVMLVLDSNAALEAVRFGKATVASVDGAAGWLAWQRLGLEAVAAETRSDGRTHYMASAWTRADTDIMGVDDFEGRTSCHTGATKSAGMMMPMSYLIKEGLIDTSGYADDVSSLQEMARDFFDEPVIGAPYAGYNGALQCLSEGVGDIAFIRDTTPADYCESDPEDWCLELDQYRKILDFGPVPEHPFMVSPDLDPHLRDELVAALLALNESEEGHAILDATFGTHGIAEVDTEDHLGGYGALIENIPGIEAYAESK